MLAIQKKRLLLLKGFKVFDFNFFKFLFKTKASVLGLIEIVG